MSENVEPVFRRLKIVGDGRRQGTKVVDAETGDAIDGVVALSWSMDQDATHATCTITVRRVMADFEGDALVRTVYA